MNEIRDAFDEYLRIWEELSHAAEKLGDALALEGHVDLSYGLFMNWRMGGMLVALVGSVLAGEEPSQLRVPMRARILMWFLEQI
jgi:hypothetical protein